MARDSSSQQDQRGNRSDTDRRSVLKKMGAGAVGAVMSTSGCLSGFGGSDGDSGGMNTEAGASQNTGENSETTETEAADVDISKWEQADVNWTKYEGETLSMLLTRNPVITHLKPLVPTFEELTGMNVDIVQYPESEYRQKRLTDVSTGAGTFDGFLIGQPLMQYHNANWLEPLGQYMNSEELFDPEWYNKDDIVDAAISIAKGRNQLDQMVGMPVTTEATLVFYREDLYEEQGLEIAETFEDYRQNVKVLDENYDFPGVVARGQKGYGMNVYPFSGVLRSFGGQYWTEYKNDSGLDTDASIEAADYYSSLLQDFCPQGASSYNWSDCMNQMSSGAAGHWGVTTSYFYETLTDPEESQVPDQIGIAPHPEGPGGTKPNTFSWLMTASAESDKPGAAWLFMMFASCPPTQEFITTERGFPPIRKSLYPEMGQEYVDVVLPMLEQAQPTRWDPKFTEWGQKVSVKLQSIIAGDLSPEQGFNQAAQEMENTY